MPTTIYLGNRAAVEVAHNETGQLVRTVLPEGKRCTLVRPPDDIPLGELFTTITHGNGVWAYHSDDPPAWVAVESDNPKLASALAGLLSEHYGGIEIREPDPDHQAAGTDEIAEG